jgi:hypothetical protein
MLPETAPRPDRGRMAAANTPVPAAGRSSVQMPLREAANTPMPQTAVRRLELPRAQAASEPPQQQGVHTAVPQVRTAVHTAVHAWKAQMPKLAPAARQALEPVAEQEQPLEGQRGRRAPRQRPDQESGKTSGAVAQAGQKQTATCHPRSLPTNQSLTSLATRLRIHACQCQYLLFS